MENIKPKKKYKKKKKQKKKRKLNQYQIFMSKWLLSHKTKGKSKEYRNKVFKAGTQAYRIHKNKQYTKK